MLITWRFCPFLFGRKTMEQFGGRSLAGLHEYSPDEVAAILDLADKLKDDQKTGRTNRPLEGKVLAMIFQKPSTRTRVSFEVGIYQLGGTGLYLGAGDMQLGRGETIADTARVLSRYCDGIMARVFSHQDILDLAEYASVPVINGLSDLLHPCQVLADLQTIREKKSVFEGLRFVYVGDGNNMAHSLMFGCAKVGMDCVVIHPEGFAPDAEMLALSQEDAKETGADISATTDIKAVKGADIVYTDVWASMGQEEEHEKRVRVFKPYQINDKLVSRAKPDCIVMHCLPAHRGEEITDSVVDGPHSVVFNQAENRLHAQKAVMVLLMS
jgi:ornithine carbamoyltransferase